MKFQIGDVVQVGARIGTIIDVGTVLIQFKTNDGCSRVANPSELVKSITWLLVSQARCRALGRNVVAVGAVTSNVRCRRLSIFSGSLPVRRFRPTDYWVYA
jgi:hypothetical protein